MINHKHYTYRVSWSADDNEFIALCAEFPGLSYLAEDQELALKGIMDTVQSVIKDMMQNQEKIPMPFSDRQYSGKFQIRIPPNLHRHISIEAAEMGVSLNRYVASKIS